MVKGHRFVDQNDHREKLTISNMLELKGNMKGSYRDMDYSCLGCANKATVEDQSHVLRCPAYADIRKDLDLGSQEDIVKYFRKVMLLRMKQKK